MIDSKTKIVVYDNTTIDEAIEQHKRINGRIKAYYGISTHLATQIADTEINKRSFPYFLTR